MASQSGARRYIPIDNTGRHSQPIGDPSREATDQRMADGEGVEQGSIHMNSDWDDVSFVISSQYRIAVLQRLADGPATPSRIANDADLGIAHISRALQGLRERNLVELLVSEDRRKGRVYGITEKGNQVWQKIEAENMV